MAGSTWTTLGLLQTTTRFLEERGRDEPRLAAERLLASVLQCRRMDLYLDTERPLQETELAPYRDLVRTYAAGAPLQYVVGETEFMGLPLRVDRRALIPRPETEILVDAVRWRLGGETAMAPRVLELGTGSGAISVSLAVLVPGAEFWATEISPAAASLARDNAGLHGVESRVHVVATSGFAALSPALDGAFDAIVSNPPYVRTAEMAALPAVVRDHEPIQALDGGSDGLEFYRYLVDSGLRFLTGGGSLVVEVGAGQSASVRDMFDAAGLQEIEVLRDYADLDRVVLGRRG